MGTQRKWRCYYHSSCYGNGQSDRISYTMVQVWTAEKKSFFRSFFWETTECFSTVFPKTAVVFQKIADLFSVVAICTMILSLWGVLFFWQTYFASYAPRDDLSGGDLGTWIKFTLWYMYHGLDYCEIGQISEGEVLKHTSSTIERFILTFVFIALDRIHMIW